jgi:hypothetical protein
MGRGALSWGQREKEKYYLSKLDNLFSGSSYNLDSLRFWTFITIAIKES